MAASSCSSPIIYSSGHISFLHKPTSSRALETAELEAQG